VFEQLEPVRCNEAAIDQIIQAGNCTAKLFKNDITPTESTVLADLTEADYENYADQFVSLSEETAPEGTQVSLSSGDWFNSQSDVAAPAQDVYGIAIVTAFGTPVLAMAARFPSAPVSIFGAEKQLRFILQLYPNLDIQDLLRLT